MFYEVILILEKYDILNYFYTYKVNQIILNEFSKNIKTNFDLTRTVPIINNLVDIYNQKELHYCLLMIPFPYKNFSV